MKKITLYSLLSTLFLLSACTTTKPTPAGMAVNIVDSKPTGCESLGELDTTGYYMDREEADNYVRNRTVAAGGDTLRISKTVNFSDSQITFGSNDYWGHKGYMYKCKK